MSKPVILFVDPMSYNNLALYDYNLMLNLRKGKIIFACNVAYNLPALSQTYRIFSYQKCNSCLKPLSYIFSMFKIVFISIINRVNIVHFQWLKIPVFDLFIIKILKLINIKVVYTAHNVLPHDSGMKYKFVFNLIYKNVNSVICHTNYAQLQLKKLFPLSNVAVIPHGLLDLGIFEVDDGIDINMLSQLKNRQGIVFSFIGNLSTYKGIDTVVDTWLSSDFLKDSNATLLIAGSGTIPNIREISKTQNVLVFNWLLTNREFLFCIEQSDYVLMPYKAISQSGLLLTALANNKKIVVSNLPPLIEPFECISKDLGYVLKENTVDSLRDTLEGILSENQEPLSADIASKISDYYDWTIIGDKTSSLYNKILE